MQETLDIEALNQEIYEASALIDRMKASFSDIIVGQEYMIDRLLIGLLTKGHILLEGMPGLAKTLAIKTLATSINAKFSRIQFTPDLLPADIIGTLIFNPNERVFEVRKGPVFANFVLADEINRAPAKVQAALLEAMQERQVTIGDETFNLEEPFLVLATQNPIEQEGTYPLPEAQMDRFMFKVHVGYPNRFEERKVLEMQSTQRNIEISPVASSAQILKARNICSAVFMDDKVKDYILDLVFSTREASSRKNLRELAPYISIGASPRATISLAKGAKAKAFLEGRGFATPDDVKSVATDILRHRIVLSFEAQAEEISPPYLIKQLLALVPTP